MNTEGQPRPDDVLAIQQQHVEKVKTQAAGQELLARFSSLSEDAIPAVPTPEEQRQAVLAERRAQQLEGELARVEQSIHGLDPRFVHPGTREHIESLRGQIAELRTSLQPTPQVEKVPTATDEIYEVTENHELGTEKLQQLYGHEREVAKRVGEWLGSQDDRRRQYDQPRYRLRKDLIANHLLPTFILGREQKAINELKEKGQVDPERVLRVVDNEVSTVDQQIHRSSYSNRELPLLPYDFNDLNSQPSEAFLFTLLCNNTDSAIHVRGGQDQNEKNGIRYYAETLKKSNSYGSAPSSPEVSLYPVTGSLDPLFQRYPELAREVAVIQAAEKIVGEKRSLFAESVAPPYEIKAEDKDRIDVLVAEFRAVNDERRARAAEQEVKVRELEEAIRLDEESNRQAEEEGQVRAQLEEARRRLEAAKKEEEQAQQIASNTEEPRGISGIFNVPARQEYNRARADLAGAKLNIERCERAVAALEQTVEKFGRVHRQVNEILGKFGLFRSEQSYRHTQRLEQERRHLQGLQELIATNG